MDSIEAFETIGKDYREHHKGYLVWEILRRSCMFLILAPLLFGMLVLIAGILIQSSSEINLWWAIIVAAMIGAFIAFAITVLVLIIQSFRRLRFDDESLGRATYKISKRAKKSALHRYLPILIVSVCAEFAYLIAFVEFGLPYLIEPIVKEEELVQVQGTLEKCYAKKNGLDDGIIYLTGDPVQYRVPASLYSYVDPSFFDEPKLGEQLTLQIYVYVGKNGSSSNSEQAYPKVRDYPYTIKGETKDYLTYEGYLSSAQDRQRIGLGITVACFSFSGICDVALMATIPFLILGLLKADIPVSKKWFLSQEEKGL